MKNDEHKKYKNRLIFKTGFSLYGQVIDKTDDGVWFKTDSETSFINYSEIKVIRGDY
jgi:hypothetical protein